VFPRRGTRQCVHIVVIPEVAAIPHPGMTGRAFPICWPRPEARPCRHPTEPNPGSGSPKAPGVWSTNRPSVVVHGRTESGIGRPRSNGVPPGRSRREGSNSPGSRGCAFISRPPATIDIRDEGADASNEAQQPWQPSRTTRSLHRTPDLVSDLQRPRCC